jgi:hypothetical protein
MVLSAEHLNVMLLSAVLRTLQCVVLVTDSMIASSRGGRKDSLF